MTQARRIVLLTVENYLNLVDWTGRAMKSDKLGAIPKDFGCIVERMELDTENWVESVQRYGGLFYRIAGRADRLASAARKAGQRWMRAVRPEVPMYLRKTA